MANYVCMYVFKLDLSEKSFKTTFWNKRAEMKPHDNTQPSHLSPVMLDEKYQQKL